MRYAAKVDRTHGPIRDALRACGCAVLDTSRLRGFVDLVVLRRGHVYLVECKTKRTKTGGIRKTDTQHAIEQQGFPTVYLCTTNEAILWATSQ